MIFRRIFQKIRTFLECFVKGIPPRIPPVIYNTKNAKNARNARNAKNANHARNANDKFNHEGPFYYNGQGTKGGAAVVPPGGLQ